MPIIGMPPAPKSSSGSSKLGQLELTNAKIGFIGAGALAESIIHGLIQYGKLIAPPTACLAFTHFLHPLARRTLRPAEPVICPPEGRADLAQPRQRRRAAFRVDRQRAELARRVPARPADADR